MSNGASADIPELQSPCNPHQTRLSRFRARFDRADVAPWIRTTISMRRWRSATRRYAGAGRW